MLQTSSQSSLSLVWPHPTQVCLKLQLSRCCLTTLKQNHVNFDLLQSCETTKSGTNLVQKIPTSALTQLCCSYQNFPKAVRNTSDACFRRLEMRNIMWMYNNAVLTQFCLLHPMLQVMANAYLHFCSHSRGSGRSGRKRQDTPPSPVAGIEPVNCGKTCLLI